MKVSALIVAAGQGERFGSKKQFMPLGNHPLLYYATKVFNALPPVEEIILIVPAEDVKWVREKFTTEYAFKKISQVIKGGNSRGESVYLGLQALRAATEIVLIHDGARPMISQDFVLKIIEQTKIKGACIPVLKATDTIKAVNEAGEICQTLPRQNLRHIQTPQGFKKDIICEAYQTQNFKRAEQTDDAGLLEKAGYPISTIAGLPYNVKVTVKEDFLMLEGLIAGKTKTGIGIDIHQLTSQRPLILAGITIPYHLGCAAHSDGDVVTHAIMDALLGASGLRDIGYYFPDTHQQYQGISSLKLLQKVQSMLKEKNMRINHIDCTIVLEKPRLQPFISQMRQQLASVLNLKEDSVAIKATTAEKLGFIGRGEGIMVQAVATCQQQFREDD